MTSENIERVRAIGSHVASPLTILTKQFSTGTTPVRLSMGTTAVILQQVTGEDVMTGSLADLANSSFSCRGWTVVRSGFRR